MKSFALKVFALSILLSVTSHATARVKGFVDTVRKTNSGYEITGWACDEGVSEPILVHLYLGGAAGRGGQLLKAVRADLTKGDSAAISSTCNTSATGHRYRIPLDAYEIADYSARPIYVHGISKNGGANGLMNNSGLFKVPNSNVITRHWFGKNKVISEGGDLSSINLSGRKFADFDGDGVFDQLICPVASNYNKDGVLQRRTAEIFSGASGKRIAAYTLPVPDQDNYISYFMVCDIVDIYDGKPSVVFSTFKQKFNNGNDKRHAAQRVWFNGLDGLNMLVLNGANNRGRVVGQMRSADCTEITNRMKAEIGYSGALCFWADYDASSTVTALVSLRSDDGVQLKVTDISGESNLPWRNGLKGTSRSEFTNKQICGDHNSWRHDGIFMMAGAFVDYNYDGLPDLLTAGQHTSLIAHEMMLDSSSQLGFTFESKPITEPDKRDSEGRCFSEYRNVRAIQRPEAKMNIPCVIISGDQPSDGDQLIEDHLRCYENESDSWELFDLPESIYANYSTYAFDIKGDKNIYFKPTRAVQYPSYPNKENSAYPGNFVVEHYGPIAGYIDGLANNADGSKRAMGWACLVNNSDEIQISAFAGKASSPQGAEITRSVVIHRVPGENGVKAECLAGRSEQSHRFQIRLPRSVLNEHSGKKLYLYARDPDSGFIKQVANSGQFVL